MATRNILMEAVKRGGHRQVPHEKIREYARQAAAEVKEGGENRLLEMIVADESFRMSAEDISRMLDPSQFVGRAPQQVEQFLKDVVDPILEENRAIGQCPAEVEV